MTFPCLFIRYDISVLDWRFIPQKKKKYPGQLMAGNVSQVSLEGHQLDLRTCLCFFAKLIQRHEYMRMRVADLISFGVKSVMRFSIALVKFKTSLKSTEFSLALALASRMRVLQLAGVVNVQWTPLLNHVHVHGNFLIIAFARFIHLLKTQ